MKIRKNINPNGCPKFLLLNLRMLVVAYLVTFILTLVIIIIADIFNSSKVYDFIHSAKYITPFHEKVYEDGYVESFWKETLYTSEDFAKVQFKYWDSYPNSKSHISAANSGNPNAQFYVGITCADLNEKVMRLIQAAEKGHLVAMDSLIAIYNNGTLNIPADNEAIIFFKQQAKNGDARSMTKIGELYLETDTAVGLQYLRKADQLGNTTAMLSLGRFYRSDKSIPNRKLSYYYYQRAMPNDPTGEALFYISTENRHSYDMDGVIESAKKGFAEAQYTLAKIGLTEDSPVGYKCGDCFIFVKPSKFNNNSFEEKVRSYYTNLKMSIKRNNNGDILEEKILQKIEQGGWVMKHDLSYRWKLPYRVEEDLYIYSTYCGYAWLICAAEKGYDKAIETLKLHRNRDSKILRDVFECVYSPIYDEIYDVVSIPSTPARTKN